jgi:hypothetical protein
VEFYDLVEGFDVDGVEFFVVDEMVIFDQKVPKFMMYITSFSLLKKFTESDCELMHLQSS